MKFEHPMIKTLRTVLTQPRWKAAALTLAMVALYSNDKVRAGVESNITLPIDFRVRELLGQGVVLSPQVKIYGFDDATLDYLQRSDLSLLEWQNLLTAIAAARPEGIYIDKLFGMPEASGREAFVANISSLPTEVSVGGFISPGLTRGSALIDLASRSQYLAPQAALQTPLWSTLPIISGHFVGPHRSVQNAFHHIGHIMYADGGQVAPLLRLGAHVLPHITLSTHAITFTNEGLLYDGHSIPIDGKGLLIPNMIDPERLARSVISLKSALQRVRNGGDFTSVVQPGQAVLIIPGLFTGNGDWSSTPLGMAPGGYILASMLNSVVSQQWLVKTSWDWLYGLFGGVGGVAVAHLASPITWLYSVILGALGFAVLGLACFAYADLVIAWPLPVVTFLSTTLWLFALLRQQRERQLRDEEIKRKLIHEAAMAVQQSIFHHPQTIAGPFRFAASYRAAETLAGDWYGFYESPNKDQAFLMIGDVTGHGFSSALLAGLVAGSVKTAIANLHEKKTETKTCLEFIAKHVNAVLYDAGFRVGKSMTMAFVGLDWPARKVYLLNCAHHPVYLCRKGSTKTMAVGGSLLGFQPDVDSPVTDWDLESGDLLFAHTDGLWDNASTDGKRIKRSEVKSLLAQASSASALITALDALMDQRWLGAVLIDDSSCCAVEVGVVTPSTAAVDMGPPFAQQRAGDDTSSSHGAI